MSYGRLTGTALHLQCLAKVIMDRTNRGFTLIELLVVIAIIGMLSSVVLASLNTARSKARDAQRRSDLHQLSIALELYRDKYGGYPSSSQSGCRGDGWCLDDSGQASWIPGLTEFMSSLPKNSQPYGSPAWPYHYTSNVYGYWIMVGMENTQGTCAAGVMFPWYDDPNSNACWWGGNMYAVSMPSR